MDLTGLEADIERIAARRGTMLVRSAGGGDYRHGGIMKGTTVDVSPIETKKDENGETRQVGAAIRVETRLMQTEATTAFRLMKEITSGRIDLILAPQPVSATLLTGTEAEQVGELSFAGRHLKIGGRLRFDRGESFLPARIEFRASMQAIDSFTL